MPLRFIKAHAYGNDFLFIDESAVANDEKSNVARAVCDRHSGVGADGLIFYRLTALGAAMKLFNADGSLAEVSGNGVRCLAAVVLNAGETTRDGQQAEPVEETVIETDGGIKVVTLLDSDPPRYTFRAFMGEPLDMNKVDIEAAGESVSAVTLSVGNPQCVVLTDHLDDARFRRLGPALATHESFPDGTNVEFAQVTRSDEVQILIWERGVGPTSASGTGACASAVAAAAFGGAGRSMNVLSPGGAQHVEWLSDGIYLTGWAEIVAEGDWVG